MNNKSSNNFIILNNSKVKGKLLAYEEYYLIYSNIIYKIIVGKKEEGIIIKSKNYMITFNKKDFSSLNLLITYNFDNIDEIYNLIINSFVKNKVIIKNLSFYKKLILNMKMYINNIEKDIEFILEYNPNNKEFNYLELNNNYNKVVNEIEILKKQINKLKGEIEELKLYYKNKNPIDIHSLPDLTKESYSDDVSDNTFTIFKTIQGFYYIVFSNKNKSIINYNLIEKKKLIEIKSCHYEYITNFRHHLDKYNKRDLVLSLSYMDKNIKIWNVHNWDCILNLTNIYNHGFIYSACFLDINNTNYILTSNCNLYGDSDPIIVYDINGKKFKQIKDSYESTSFIDTYFDKSEKCYIITGNSNFVKSYDYIINEEYNKYSDNYNNNHLSVIINETEKITKLIESCYDGYIRVWDFNTAVLLNKIKIGDWLYGICLWNDSYLFVGCSDKLLN